MDSSNAYWANLGGGSIARAPVTGGSVTLVAQGQAIPFAIAIDANNIYWTNNGNGANQGSVMTLAK